jgi:DNA-directed RNA polymerase specialized sigma24 family protein
LKHGGNLVRRDVNEVPIADPAVDEDLLAINDALDQLAMVDPQAAELVKLRYFAGLAIPEAAEVLGISPRTADRVWAYAKAWLFEKLQD